MAKITQFLLEVRSEFRKVSWPSRAETIALTIMVMLLLVVMTVYIGAWDLFFQNAISWILNRGF
jgi:preprotein translocase subunit SecE